MTVARVAENLGVCKMTVYRLIHAGQIDAVKVGKSYRISEKDFKAYLRRVRTRGNTSESAGPAQARGVHEG